MPLDSREAAYKQIDPITVRITVQRMAQEIATAFSAQQLELSEIVKEALQQAIKDFNVGQLAYDETMRHIQEEVKRQVKSTISHLMWSPEARKAIEEGVRKGLELCVKEREDQ